MNPFKSIVKFGVGVALGVSLCISAKAGTATVTVNAGTITNVFSFTPNIGSLFVKSMTVSSVGATPQTVQLVDTPTNLLVYTTLGYTNKVSYATNYTQVWTNFYGVIQTNNVINGVVYTNYALIDITNSVPQGTNNYNVRAYVVCPTNNTVVFPLNQYFNEGVWASNSSTAGGPASVTITW